VTRLLLGPLLRHVGTTDATIWVETDAPCEVEVLGHRERTWTVAGHHYALIAIEGLSPDSSTAYQVRLDGDEVWPEAESGRPAPRIRTTPDSGPIRIAFGSCRYARSSAVQGDQHFDADALVCLARSMGAAEPRTWPHALVLLGDQVYADETSPDTQRRIRQRRDITKGSGAEVADYEEYTWLYHESWTDPDVRWLLSTVPSSMIFDDHDVRDDWNTSHSWRLDIQAQPWWHERIVGALSSYWVYQHLGNLSPDQLADDVLYQKVRGHGGDAESLVREFAKAADAEADGAKGARWSFRRDYGPVRLIVIDSRCGRILAQGRRAMIGDAEFDWIEEQLHGDYDHLLIGTSLPWLMPRALHDLESWNEVLCDGRRGQRIARWSEKLRRAADLEHWASFRDSFDRLAVTVRDVGRGRYATAGGRSPSSVCVLSGDVHHAYVARASFPGWTSPAGTDSAVYQLTCSPLHNHVPTPMRLTFRAAWSRVAERSTRAVLGVVAKVPPMIMEWSRKAGPYFGDELMTMTIQGRSAELVLEKAGPVSDPRLTEIARLTLA
jgi:phosphodiesterase/alkaline phosphatase D-like protein